MSFWVPTKFIRGQHVSPSLSLTYLLSKFLTAQNILLWHKYYSQVVVNDFSEQFVHRLLTDNHYCLQALV
ncbi:MAG: hypothetical protein CMIDDMOC_00520 [Sodalis sp. Fle]|nr:MAG: hypothetical protein CMIDDMOC_00520 [Sodalis sp. Fle]